MTWGKKDLGGVDRTFRSAVSEKPYMLTGIVVSICPSIALGVSLAEGLGMGHPLVITSSVALGSNIVLASVFEALAMKKRRQKKEVTIVSFYNKKT